MNEIVKGDQKVTTTLRFLLVPPGETKAHRLSSFQKIGDAADRVDRNTMKLIAQSKRLKENAYKSSNCWIYVMLLVVIVTFIYLTLFMRMFRKRTILPASPSSFGAKSTLLDNSINQTSINQSNGTEVTTKSTDYISLLLNYANENHTDF